MATKCLGKCGRDGIAREFALILCDDCASKDRINGECVGCGGLGFLKITGVISCNECAKAGVGTAEAKAMIQATAESLDPGGTIRSDLAREQADRDHSAALAAAASILRGHDAIFIDVMEMAWDTAAEQEDFSQAAEGYRKIATFCRKIVSELRGGRTRDWLSEVGDAMDNCARTGDELHAASECGAAR